MQKRTLSCCCLSVLPLSLTSLLPCFTSVCPVLSVCHCMLRRSVHFLLSHFAAPHREARQPTPCLVRCLGRLKQRTALLHFPRLPLLARHRLLPSLLRERMPGHVARAPRSRACPRLRAGPTCRAPAPPCPPGATEAQPPTPLPPRSRSLAGGRAIVALSPLERAWLGYRVPCRHNSLRLAPALPSRESRPRCLGARGAPEPPRLFPCPWLPWLGRLQPRVSPQLPRRSVSPRAHALGPRRAVAPRPASPLAHATGCCGHRRLLASSARGRRWVPVQPPSLPCLPGRFWSPAGASPPLLCTEGEDEVRKGV